MNNRTSDQAFERLRTFSSDKEADDLFEKFWEWRLKESPEFATLIGFHEYDGCLETYNLHTFEERIKTCKLFVADAFHILTEDLLNSNSSLSLNFLITELNTYLKGMEMKGYLFPITYLDGIHLELPLLIEDMVFQNLEDFRKLVSRFKALPRYVSEIIDVMKEGIMMNMTPHEMSMTDVLKQLDDLETNLDISPFFKPFLIQPIGLKSEDWTNIRKQAEAAIICDVLPAFQTLKNFLKFEYLEHLRPNPSIVSLPNGEHFYLRCLKSYLGLAISPQEIHKIGLMEIARIKDEIERVIESEEIIMSIDEFKCRLRDEKDFYFHTPEELSEAYVGIISNKIRPSLSKVFNNIPKLKLVNVHSDSTINNKFSYNASRIGADEQVSVFYVDEKQLNNCPIYGIMRLALHEVEPGQHFLFNYTRKMKCMPEFRRFIVNRKYSCNPSKFPSYAALIEGWALYSEYLGYELNMYDDSFFEYGYLCHELFRACCLVIDTGVHAFGWSPDYAVQYMIANTALREDEAACEVNRCITWPGHACTHKMGQLKIKQLRKKAEMYLGAQFDLCEFHDIVLHSIGPLSFLERNVDAYIHHQSCII